MNALAVLCVAATVGIDYGWTARDDGGVEYIIQIEPHVAEALRSGELPNGVASEVIPEVTNVRAFRIVIGEEDLPRDPIAEVMPAAATGDAEPHTSMLAADTAPTLRGYQNPRYQPPATEITRPSATIRRTADAAADQTRDATGQLLNDATNRLGKEATKLGQGIENAVQNGVRDVGNALRNGIQTTGAQQPDSQPGLNPAINGNLESRMQSIYGTGQPNGGQISPYANTNQGQPQPASTYTAPGTTSNWQTTTNQSSQPNSSWPQPMTTPPPTQNPGEYNNGLPQRQWQTWQGNNQNIAGQSQPNPAVGGNQWQTNPPANVPNNPGYQNGFPNQGQPAINPPNQQPTAPPTQPMTPYGQGMFAGNNQPTQPGSVGGNFQMQPGGQIQPPVTPVQHQVAQNPVPNPASTPNPTQQPTPQPNANETAQNPPQSGVNDQQDREPQDSRVSGAPDPNSFQWIIMFLLLFSIAGNLVQFYITNNFKQQSHKIAMQLRRARAA